MFTSEELNFQDNFPDCGSKVILGSPRFRSIVLLLRMKMLNEAVPRGCISVDLLGGAHFRFLTPFCERVSRSVGAATRASTRPIRERQFQ